MCPRIGSAHKKFILQDLFNAPDITTEFWPLLTIKSRSTKGIFQCESVLRESKQVKIPSVWHPMFVSLTYKYQNTERCSCSWLVNSEFSLLIIRQFKIRWTRKSFKRWTPKKQEVVQSKIILQSTIWRVGAPDDGKTRENLL